MAIAPGIYHDGRERLVGQPLGPRSIVLSILLGSHPPQMPVGHLLEFTSLFGLADGAVRTALSRMVAARELDNRDGRYRLTGRLLERQSQQDVGREVSTSPWDRTWWFAIVTADRRTVAERREFRTRAEAARFGELRPDTWIRPANIDAPHDFDDVVLTRGPLLSGDGRALAAQLWDLSALDRRAIDLGADLLVCREHLAELEPAQALPDAFVAMAATQRHLRIEPQLPPELTASTAGRELRASYDTTVRLFESSLAEFFARTNRPVRRVSTDGR